ncbi:Chloride Channel Protein 1 [Manis pentadactyla]|nr:Chloride Channel Protein 1 [Manis pentadactyla]
MEKMVPAENFTAKDHSLMVPRHLPNLVPNATMGGCATVRSDSGILDGGVWGLFPLVCALFPAAFSRVLGRGTGRTLLQGLEEYTLIRGTYT